MRILVDTNILVRSVQLGHPQQPAAADSVETLRQQGDKLFLVPQNLYEFWVVCTRPASANGLGLTVAEAHDELKKIRAFFALLGDDIAVCDEWEHLVVR